MPGLPDLSRDLARQYRITVADANEIIRFINEDMVVRLAEGQDLYIDAFGVFLNESGTVRFKPSKVMRETIEKYNSNSVKVTGED